jgi:hypothetical protein
LPKHEINGQQIDYEDSGGPGVPVVLSLLQPRAS